MGAEKPHRIQRRRTKGWRMPEGAVYVGRPTRWGNPFPVNGDWTMWTAVALGYRGNPAGRREAAVALHRGWINGQPVPVGPHALPSGGYLEFNDGTSVALSEHVRGIAAFASTLAESPTVGKRPTSFEELSGKDLACWCPLDQPCHADVLLDLANR